MNEETVIRSQPFPGGGFFDDEERKGILEVIQSGVLSGFVANAGEQFLGGKKVRELEEDVCRLFHSKYAVAVNSATAGLHAALAACGVGPGDEVLVPPLTMSASASAILMQSALPVFVDIRDDIFSVDERLLESKVTSRTKALVVVHLFGHPAEMDSVLKIARKHHLKVIEDCAQAPGALYKGCLVGTLGDAGVLSLNQHKTITTGEGGMVLCNDEAIAMKVRLVRNHGEAVVEGLGVKDISNTLGWNYRMTELEAAVAIGQFRKLDFLTRYRQELASYLTSSLSRFEELRLPETLPNCNHVYFLYAIRWVPSKKGLTRDEVVQRLNREGIPFGAGYVKPLYLQPMYQQRICFGNAGWPFTSVDQPPNYAKGICPVAERMYEQELLVTSVCRYPVTKADIDDIARAFDKILAGNLASKR